MHAVSTILFLASMGTGAFAIDLVGSPFHGIVFTSVDSNCFLPGAPFTPSDGDKGQFADEIKGVKSQLDCKLFLREEKNGVVQKEPVLVIEAGDTSCHELPESGLHWNVDCEGDDEEDKVDDEDEGDDEEGEGDDEDGEDDDE